VYYLSQLAHGEPDERHGPPADLVERSRRWPGSIDIDYDTLSHIEALFDGASCLSPSVEFSTLYLDNSQELWAIAHARDMAKDLSRGNPDRQRWLEVKDAIKRMRAHRLALGLDGLEWNLG